MTVDMDSLPLVSVVTPSYNQAQFIQDTIESVACQRYPNIEYIVVDGCSDDGTTGILQNYDDQLTWISEPDEGQSDAVNKGFDMADGDIIAWLNSDDVLFDVDTIYRVVKYFEKFDTDIIYGDIALLNSKADVLKLQIVPDFDYEKLLIKCFIEQPSLFFRSCVLENERLNTNLEYVMDYEFWLRLAKDYDFQHIDDVFSGDRNHYERKILKEREAMKAEAEKLRAEYGGPIGAERKRKQKVDLVRSGVPRAFEAAIRTVRLHREGSELAFDGQLRPVFEMVWNISQQNQELV